jgi:hypothetical protein
LIAPAPLGQSLKVCVVEVRQQVVLKGPFKMLSLLKFLVGFVTYLLMISVSCAAAPENGWWWNPTESGSGYAIERQGNSIFMAAFLYETTGAATW